MGQILQYHFAPPEAYENNDNMSYMVKRFIPRVKQVLKEHNFQQTKDGRDIGGTFLVGYSGELYEIYEDYQVSRVCQPYYACGCGRDLLLGSLFTTEKFAEKFAESVHMTPKNRIQTALSVAQEFSAGVCAPFHIIHS